MCKCVYGTQRHREHLWSSSILQKLTQTLFTLLSVSVHTCTFTVRLHLLINQHAAVKREANIICLKCVSALVPFGWHLSVPGAGFFRCRVPIGKTVKENGTYVWCHLSHCSKINDGRTGGLCQHAPLVHCTFRKAFLPQRSCCETQKMRKKEHFP